MSKFKVGDKVVRKPKYRNDKWRARYKDHPEGAMLDSIPYIWDPDYFALVVGSDQETLPAPTPIDEVNSPKHYQFFPDLEAIEVIARSMTQEQFYGYCLGNRLKYRLRAGNKDKLEQDIAKSDKYLELYEQHKGNCIDAK